MGFTSRVCAVNFCLILPFSFARPSSIYQPIFLPYLKTHQSKHCSSYTLIASYTCHLTSQLLTSLPPPWWLGSSLHLAKCYQSFKAQLKPFSFMKQSPFAFIDFFFPLPKRLSPVLLIKYRIYPTLYYWVLFKKKKNLFIFYWRILALQNFAVFCQTSTWTSHRYTYIPSVLKLPPISLPIPLL